MTTKTTPINIYRRLVDRITVSGIIGAVIGAIMAVWKIECGVQIALTSFIILMANVFLHLLTRDIQ